MPATVPTFQDHFISVARPGPRHQVESLERDRLPAALAPPVLLRSLVQPLERGVDLGKLRGLARGVHDIPLLVGGVRPPVSRLLLNRVAGCAIVARERVHYACALLEQAGFQVLPLCRGQRHAPSPWEIAARHASRKHRDAATMLRLIGSTADPCGVAVKTYQPVRSPHPLAGDLPPFTGGPHYYGVPVARVTSDAFTETIAVLRCAAHRRPHVTVRCAGSGADSVSGLSGASPPLPSR